MPMVLEQIYRMEFLRKHPMYGFLLGITYTVLGMFLALLIFKSDPALIAVGITSILLMPCLYQSSTMFIKTSSAFKDFVKNSFWNIKLYVFIFFGIFFTFAFFSILLPSLAANHLFQIQLAIVKGSATTFSFALFLDLFTWNLQVLLLAFFISLIAGNGAIIFIAWNASVWGTIFGNLAKTAALTSGANTAVVFLLIILSVLPHTLLEGLSYIVATVGGTTISDGVAKEKLFSKRMWRVVRFGALLTIISIGILCIGMLVETFVLNNFNTYRMIIEMAFPR